VASATMQAQARLGIGEVIGADMMVSMLQVGRCY
jgi:hypothetical protein